MIFRTLGKFVSNFFIIVLLHHRSLTFNVEQLNRNALDAARFLCKLYSHSNPDWMSRLIALNCSHLWMKIWIFCCWNKSYWRPLKWEFELFGCTIPNISSNCCTWCRFLGVTNAKAVGKSWVRHYVRCVVALSLCSKDNSTVRNHSSKDDFKLLGLVFSDKWEDSDRAYVRALVPDFKKAPKKYLIPENSQKLTESSQVSRKTSINSWT